MRARMTWSLALFIALFIWLLSAFYLLDARRSLERSFTASLDRAALESSKLASSRASLKQLRTLIEEHNDQVAQSGAIAEGVEAWLLDAQQKELWRLGPPPPGIPPEEKAEPLKLPPPSNTIPPLDKPDDWRIRNLKWGQDTLVLALPWHRARHDLNRQAVALGILSLLISGAAALGAWMSVGKTLQPIDELARQARDSALDPIKLVESRIPLQPTSSDMEMRNLVKTLNQMLDNVYEAALSKERFHTSASHELRTPLQALAGHLGVTLARDRSAPEYKEAVQEAAVHTARLSKLTKDLLLLNRVQTGASELQREKVDVEEIGDIALQRAEKTIATRGLKVVAKWEALEIEAPPSHVEILLGNLAENAAKYAREGGQIGIEIESVNRAVRVWNDCDLKQFRSLEKQVSQLFEPFYRPDSARSSDNGGNGLGLAICHSIAQANGWQLTIEMDEQKFSVQVTF